MHKNIFFLFRRIVEKLKELHRHKEAAQVLVEHLNDPEEAFVAFIEGQLWNEAVQLMHSQNRSVMKISFIWLTHCLDLDLYPYDRSHSF